MNPIPQENSFTEEHYSSFRFFIKMVANDPTESETFGSDVQTQAHPHLQHHNPLVVLLALLIRIPLLLHRHRPQCLRTDSHLASLKASQELASSLAQTERHRPFLLAAAAEAALRLLISPQVQVQQRQIHLPT